MTFLKKISLCFAFFLLLFAIFLGIDRYVHQRLNQLFIHRIYSHHKPSAEWEMSILSLEDQKELDRVLNQKFTYYNKGSQSYVFISEDKKYILKFLKQHKLRSSSWLAYAPFNWNPYYQDYLFKKKKCQETFNACKTAFTHLKKETGLLYVHINPTKDLNKKVIVFDKNEKKHTIEIDKTSFYIQRRAQLIYSRISELMYDRDIDRAKYIISSVFSLIDFLGKKGVVNNDPILRKNFGLIDDIAVQIDVGKLRIDPLREHNLDYQREVGSITYNFKLWLEKNYPELLLHFEQCLKKAVGD